MTSITNKSSTTPWIEKHFKIANRGSNLKTEIVAGATTFLTMVYSCIVIPQMMSGAGFDYDGVYLATCIVSGLGALIMGFWANVPMAIGVAIPLTAYLSFTLVLGNNLSIQVALAAVFLTGVVFTIVTATGIRTWILKNLPSSIANGAGIGIGLFLFLIATADSGIIVANTHSPIPVELGEFVSFPVMLAIFGLGLVVALEALKVTGGVLISVIILTVIAVIFDPNIHFSGVTKLPAFSNPLIGGMDLSQAFNLTVLPPVFALVITAIFDATSSIRAVAAEANLVEKDGTIQGGGRALASDSIATMAAGFFGTGPTAVYIESAAGTAAGGRTGVAAIVTGALFLLMIFFQPLAALVPPYCTAPALMYVGLLLMSNVTRLDFSDHVGALSGLVTAVFILLSANIVTGIMIGFLTLVTGRVITREFKKLNLGTIIITVILFVFYVTKLAV